MMALARKEWREHWRFVLLLHLIGGAIFALLWIAAQSAVSPLQAWRSQVVMFGTLAAVVLPNRLVMREYGLGTQLFLETLPIGRGRVLLTKWLAGWGALMLFFVPAFCIALYVVRDQVYLRAGLVGLVALRSIVYLLFVYAGAFAIALTLRFRFVVWGLLLLLVATLSERVQQPMAEWPPFLVAGDAMALLGAPPPWRELAITAGLALGLMGVSIMLAVSARGALAVVLARRMSSRARTLMAFAFGLVAGLSTLLEKREPPPPFRLEQAVSSRGDPVVHVGWRGDVGGMPAAQLAAQMSSDLAAVRTWLGLRQLAPVSLVPDAWREAHEISFGKARPNQLVVRAALGAPELALQQLRETVRIAEILDQSPAYVWREDRTWLLRGFSAWWEAERTEGYAALLRRRADFASRLLRAHGMDDETALREADTTDEVLGECLGSAYAWRAVQILHERLGPARYRSLMRAALGQPTSDDARSLVRVAATADLLAREGLPLPQLALAMRQDQGQNQGPAQPSVLRVEATRLAGAMSELRYRITGATPAGLTVRYKALSPGDAYVDPKTAYWAGAAASGVLPATFAAGTRVFVMAEAFDSALGCRYRLGAVREALP
ncbi:ABC transporter permease [Massilia aerilata]|uniref:ABC transporter permease n=1 Tax=Massilia aerilata TaxID=453817 RepID=A0ABW0RWD1_9BURK